MTDLELQEALKKEVQSILLKDGLQIYADEDWKSYNVYKQDKPQKKDPDTMGDLPLLPTSNTIDTENYIVIVLEDEEEQSDGSWEVHVAMVISIYCDDENRDGNLIIANLMNQIDRHLTKKRVIDGKYTKQRGSKKIFDQESYETYYQCVYYTTWNIPPTNEEGIEQFL